MRWSSSEGNMDVDRGQIAKAIQKAKHARTCRHKRCSHKHPYRPTASVGRAEACRIPVVRQVAGQRIWPELSLHLITGKHRLQHHERTSLFLPSIMRGECSSKAKSRASDFLRRQWCSMMIWWSWWGGAHTRKESRVINARILSHVVRWITRRSDTAVRCDGLCHLEAVSKIGDANKKGVYTIRQTPPLMWPCYLEARGNYDVARMLYPQRGGFHDYPVVGRLDLYVAADPVPQKEARALRFLGDGCHISPTEVLREDKAKSFNCPRGEEWNPRKATQQKGGCG